jgi:hypothetical protein
MTLRDQVRVSLMKWNPDQARDAKGQWARQGFIDRLLGHEPPEVAGVGIGEFVDKIRNLPYEHAAIFTPDGEMLFHRSGDKVGVSTYPGGSGLSTLRFEDGVMVHNHPDNGVANVPLSGQDIQAALYYNLQAVWAVSRDMNYVMERPKHGWGIEAVPGKAEYIAYENEARQEFDRQRIPEPQRVMAEAAFVQDYANRKMAAAHGWVYRIFGVND